MHVLFFPQLGYLLLDIDEHASELLE